MFMYNAIKGFTGILKWLLTDLNVCTYFNFIFRNIITATKIQNKLWEIQIKAKEAIVAIQN